MGLRAEGCRLVDMLAIGRCLVSGAVGSLYALCLLGCLSPI